MDRKHRKILKKLLKFFKNKSDDELYEELLDKGFIIEDKDIVIEWLDYHNIQKLVNRMRIECFTETEIAHYVTKLLCSNGFMFEDNLYDVNKIKNDWATQENFVKKINDNSIFICYIKYNKKSL